MAFSIRLDAATERAITRLARRRRQTKAAVVREALAAYETGERSRDEQPALAVLAPFIGIADSGGSRRSEDTGDAFRAVLKKSRVRRPR
jgi:hypothetical protein